MLIVSACTEIGVTMLVIRAAQLAVLAKPAIDRLRARARAHLQAHFAGQCAALGPERLGDAVDHGLARASAHGFTTEPDLLKYLNLCFTFGRDFDADPACAWAAEILGDGRLDPDERMERLHAAALREESEGEGYLGPAPEATTTDD